MRTTRTKPQLLAIFNKTATFAQEQSTYVALKGKNKKQMNESKREYLMAPRR